MLTTLQHFSTAEGLQQSLYVLSEYFENWKLTVNVAKSKIIVFRKGGRLFKEHDNLLADQELKAISKMNK